MPRQRFDALRVSLSQPTAMRLLHEHVLASTATAAAAAAGSSDETPTPGPDGRGPDGQGTYFIAATGPHSRRQAPAFHAVAAAG